ALTPPIDWTSGNCLRTVSVTDSLQAQLSYLVTTWSENGVATRLCCDVQAERIFASSAEFVGTDLRRIYAPY
ncbi:MAG: hypothetical protein ACREYC_08000, partial [Gammaproteobacteria bacterium]